MLFRALRRLTKELFALVQTKIRARFFAFCSFTMLQEQLKKRLQADRSLKNMVAIIDINAFKIRNQLRTTDA